MPEVTKEEIGRAWKLLNEGKEEENNLKRILLYFHSLQADLLCLF